MEKRNYVNKHYVKVYNPPTVSVEMIYLEQGIAENSTTVTPGDDGGDVSVGDWGNGGEIGGNIDW